MCRRVGSTVRGFGRPAIYLPVILVSAAAYFALPDLYIKLTSRDPYLESLAHDPKVGQIMPLPELDAMGRPIKPQGSKLLVFLGACNSCAINSFEEEQLRVSETVSVLIVIRGPRSTVKERSSDFKFSKVLADFDGSLERAFNVHWYPRMAMTDQRGRLVWLQSRPGVYAAGVNYGS